MEPEIKILGEKKLIGQNIQMSYAENRTFELWKNFMSRRNEVMNPVDEKLYSLQVFPLLFFEQFNPLTVFDKWAAIEVKNFDDVPNDMHKLILPTGLYAVWHYKGNDNGAALFFENIFKYWLPDAGYQIDNRFHFEILGEKYKRDDPDSEEEIWIPVKLK